MKSKFMRIVEIAIVILIILGYVGTVQAKTITKEQINELQRNKSEIQNISNEELLELYNKFTEEYSNEDMANIIEEHSQELQEKGIDKDIIDAGVKFIKTTDEETVKDILKNDINVEDIKEKVEQGYTPKQIVTSIASEMPVEQKAEITTKLLFSNQVVKTILGVYLGWLVLSTIYRWIIYNKAGRHGWAVLIPIYRQITMYKICGLSPWLMLLWFIPIFGWFAMLIIVIMKRFCLSESFGKGKLFGFGLLLLPVIFEAILAFNPNIKYEGAQK